MINRQNRQSLKFTPSTCRRIRRVKVHPHPQPDIYSTPTRGTGGDANAFGAQRDRTTGPFGGAHAQAHHSLGVCSTPLYLKIAIRLDLDIVYTVFPRFAPNHTGAFRVKEYGEERERRG